MLGLGSTTSAKDVLQPSLESDKTFSESYTLIADLGDAGYVQLQLAVSNIGLSNGRGACRALVIERDKPAWSDSVEVPRSEWSYEPGEQATLRVGQCFLKGGERTLMHVSFDRAEGVLELDARMQPYRPLDRRIVIGGSFYESDILIPWAPARLRLTISGGEERVFEGYGYGDHSRSTTFPGKLARRWVRFRGLSSAGSILMLARFPADGDQVDGWLWSQPDESPVALATVRLTPLGGEEGRDSGQSNWLIRAETISGAVYEIETRTQLYRYAPIEDGGMMTRMLKGLVGNPVTYTYRAVSSEEAHEKAGLPGIAEITIVDE